MPDAQPGQLVDRGGVAHALCASPGCHSLLFRVIDDALEVKCRRCKRITRIPLDHPGVRAEQH